MSTNSMSVEIPAHANEPVHGKLMKQMKTMTPRQRRQTLVDAGVLTKNGKLAKKYAASKARVREQTTLNLRGMPARVVRETKAAAARRGATLATVVAEALARWLESSSAMATARATSVLEADMRWYERRRNALVKRYGGQYIAILGGAVVDHDRDSGALAERVFARHGYRSIFMPRVQQVDPVMHVPSLRRSLSS